MCPRKTRTACERSAQSRSPPASSPSARITASNHKMITERFPGKKINHKSHLNTALQKTETWKTVSVYTHQSRTRWWQTGRNISLVLQSGAVHPGVGRWLTEGVRTSRAPTTTACFLKSEAPVCLSGWLTGCGGQSALVADSPATGGARPLRGSQQRVRTPRRRRREAELPPISLIALHVLVIFFFIPPKDRQTVQKNMRKRARSFSRNVLKNTENTIFYSVTHWVDEPSVPLFSQQTNNYPPPHQEHMVL